MVRSIGADQVIDYTQQDFTESGKRYDLIFDCFVNHPLSCRRALNPKGIYLMVVSAAQAVDDRYSRSGDQSDRVGDETETERKSEAHGESFVGAKDLSVLIVFEFQGRALGSF
jgi:NADPH:quinone reductase-like Zn-dependent oxidoreductase